MLCIPAPHVVLVGVQMYAQRQESALGANYEIEEFFPFLGKQLKQYAEGQLQGKMSRVPEPCGCNRLGSSYGGQRRAVNTCLLSLTVTGNLAV